MAMAKTLRFTPLAILLLIVLTLAGGLLDRQHRQETTQGFTPYAVGDIDLAALADGAEGFAALLRQEKPLVVNVFASWCLPCAAEHPVLMEWAQSGRIAFYGLAWKDSAGAVSAWLQQRGNPYREIFMDTQGSATVSLGLSGVPETLVIHRGKVVYKHASVLDDDHIRHQLLPLLERLAHE